MNVHSLAKSTPLSRLQLVSRVLDLGWRMADAAFAAGVSRSLGYRWVRCFKQFGPAGLGWRNSRPQHHPRRLHRTVIRQIGRLRCFGRTISYIAAALQLGRSTVSRWLARMGLSRIPCFKVKPQRYVMEAPGELLHVDIKKLRGFDWAGRKFIEAGGRRQRGAARQYLHIGIDSYSRYAYAEILDRENGPACIGFIERAIAHFAGLGVKLQRFLTDNGSAYRGKEMQKAVVVLDIKHSFTRVRRPQTNGKAERFIRTAMTEWGYLRFANSDLRDAALPAWLYRYNHERNHSAIGNKPPVSRMPTCEQCPGT